MDTMDGLSMNLEQTNLDRLRAVFPECFAEGKLDIDKLLGLCGEYIDNDFEKYRFEWKGKAECLRLAQKRSAGTLRPCPEESVNWDSTQNLYIEGDKLSPALEEERDAVTGDRLKRLALEKRATQLRRELLRGRENQFFDAMRLDMELEESIKKFAEQEKLTAKVTREFVIEVKGED